MQSYTRHQIAAGFGLAGMLTALALVTFGNTSDLRFSFLNEFAVVVVAGPSAWLSGLICAKLLGHAGRRGWALAVLGALLATVIGAAIAGTIGLPGVGTVLAPMILVAEILQQPALAAVWLVSVLSLHLIVLKSKV